MATYQSLSFEGVSAFTWWSGQNETEAFPVVKGTKDQKVNLWFRNVWIDCVRFFPEVAGYLGRDRDLLRGMHNTQATAWTIWACGAHRSLGKWAFAVMRAAGRDKKMLAAISNFVKGVGVHRHEWGAQLCELKTMYGRAGNDRDADGDVRGRINHKAFVRDKAALVDNERLRESVRRIIKSELVCAPVWKSVDDYWDQRWLNTRAGSHSKYAHAHMGVSPDLPDQPTRREFAENVVDCLVASGTPRVDAGLSWKDEHGASRAIYSCDTRSFFTFDYLVGPVERAWRNDRVLLNPGKVRQDKLYRRLARWGPSWYMLDFEDYNSQHTLDALAIVVDEATVGAPEYVREWARKSWYNAYIHWESGGIMREERAVGTLFSGHRCTTFCNTILNAAYCEMQLGDDFWMVDSLHAGDDVIFGGSVTMIDSVVTRMLDSVFRLNKSKQVVGGFCGEFLRHVFTREGARGYTARTISSAVSGSWVSDTIMDETEYVRTYAAMAWSLINRSGEERLGLLFESSLLTFVPAMALHSQDILRHRVSVGGMPVAKRAPGFGTTVIGLGLSKRPIYEDRRKCSYATEAYIGRYISAAVLKEAGVTHGQLHSAMLKSSYKPVVVKPGSGLTLTYTRVGAGIAAGIDALDAYPQPRTTILSEALRSLSTEPHSVTWDRIRQLVFGSDESLSNKAACSYCSYGMALSVVASITRRASTVLRLSYVYAVKS